jgi:hypothetical protein
MMGPLKRHLTPIGKDGITKHAGKGASPFPPPKPGPLTTAAPSMNNYAKATPLPTPPPAPMAAPAAPMGGSPPMGAPGLNLGGGI